VANPSNRPSPTAAHTPAAEVGLSTRTEWASAFAASAGVALGAVRWRRLSDQGAFKGQAFRRFPFGQELFSGLGLAFRSPRGHDRGCYLLDALGGETGATSR